MNTEIVILSFGKYRGERLQRVPVGYLRFLINCPVGGVMDANVGYDGTYRQLAAAELERRGSILPAIEISPHAIDRASQRLLDLYWAMRLETGDGVEGLYSWLHRLALAAWQARTNDFTAENGGVKFVYDPNGSEYPTVKTVMLAKRDPDSRRG